MKRRAATAFARAIEDYLNDHERGNHSPKTLQWLVHRESVERNPFDRVVFPKVGKPLIRTLEPDEFEHLLLACTPPGEVGRLADRAATGNRAILYHLRLGNFDRKHGTIVVKGKGSRAVYRARAKLPAQPPG